MDKITGKDEMANSDGVINHKLVFSDDALVVDYLNHLLASTPTTTSDSGEIHFVHMPTWSGLEPVVPSNTFVDNSLIFGIDHSKIAVEGLRNENESLKFNTDRLKVEAEVLRSEYESLKFTSELADIDIQVLRSENDKLHLHVEHSKTEDQALKAENDNLRLYVEDSKTTAQQLTYDNGRLKVEVAGLIAQLAVIKNTLETTSSENHDLKAQLETLQNQLVMATTVTTETEPQLREDFVLDADITPEEENGSDPDHAVPDDNVDIEPVHKEVPAATPVALQPLPPTSEITQEIALKAVVVPEQPVPAGDNIGYDRGAEIAITMPPPPLKDITKKEADSESVRRPQAAAVIDTPVQKSKPTPKVIGQHYVRKDQSPLPPNPVLQPTSQGAARPEKIHKEVEKKPVFIPELIVMEPEDLPKVTPVSNKETHHAFDADEINLEPAPAPKVVVRKNVMNYVDLQKETDPTNAAKAGHEIVL